ncbi:MAG TPA: type II toxin-antitoxin system VapC family toxin [Thermoanaerobaculia bacterium]|jgi:predicted nucleic acid-binding protein
MRFWDSSALVAIAVDEKATRSVRDLSREDPELMVWILSEVEITSALWRRRRANELPEIVRADAQRQMDLTLSNAVTVADVPAVVRRARRLLASHTLRAADAMQLAAALLACEDEPSRLPFVTIDDRLADAAAREGFTVVP